VIAVPVRTRRRLRRIAGSAAPTGRLTRHPRIAGTLLALALGTGAGLLGGPVAALLASAYTAVGFHAWLRVRRDRGRALDWTVALDALAELAGDLRAGLPPERAMLTTAARLAPVPFIVDRVGTALGVADATGAPLADLVDRLDVDLRSLERVRLVAAAHAAGTRATAALLGVLPVAGIAVGYGMGGDPLRILLRTPFGAGCALGALALQLAGLAWTARLSRPPGGDR
jgi:tight adherence protein B